MTDLFLRLVSMSMSASWLVLAVILLRYVLSRSPKWLGPALWGLVGLRMVMPFSIESHLSLMPRIPDIHGTAQTMPAAPAPTVPTAPSAGQVIHPEAIVPKAQSSIFSSLSTQDIFAIIWAVGVVAILAYALVSYLRLRRKLGTAVHFQGNIYVSDHVQSPFILGVFRPRIFLPQGLSEIERHYILAHERAHLSRLDHIWKPLGFLLLAVYWFAPPLWLAYVLLCRDIELACDEKVIRTLGRRERADYSQTLLDRSAGHRQIAACPLAFGEVGVKARVKSVLSYKKPSFWVILGAVAACIVLAVCFLTDQPLARLGLELSRDPIVTASLSDWRDNNAAAESRRDSQDPDAVPVRDTYLDDQHFRKLDRGEVLLLTDHIEDLSGFKKSDSSVLMDCDFSVLFHTVGGTSFTLSAYDLGEDVYLTTERGTFSCPGPKLCSYLYYLCLDETEKVLCWYYPSLDSASNEAPHTIDLPEFPGVSFTLEENKIFAVTEEGREELIFGMPIENIYFTDLNGDGRREICAAVLYGSGLIDSRICVYDYADHTAYDLEDRGRLDYRLIPKAARLMAQEYGYENGQLLRTGVLALTDEGLTILDPVPAEPSGSQEEDPPVETIDAAPSDL